MRRIRERAVNRTPASSRAFRMGPTGVLAGRAGWNASSVHMHVGVHNSGSLHQWVSDSTFDKIHYATEVLIVINNLLSHRTLC